MQHLNMLMRGPFLMAILCCAASAQWGVLAATPAVSLGQHHSVALARDGTVLTWGDDHAGQLGLGRRILSPAPLALGTLSGAINLSAADGYSLAIAADGTAWGWGGALAFGDGIGTDRSTPAPIAVLPKMRAISGRKYHALGLAADGTVWAWGGNNYGQIGNGNTTAQDRPVQVPGLTGITAVSVGIYHSVALRDGDGTVFTWGDNTDGQIGNGSTNDQLAPAPVPGLAGVTRISAAGNFTLALKADGSVWAWGRNLNGQLGDGTFTDRASPTRVLGLPGRATEVSAGDSYSLALMGDGTVWAWGYSGSGFQLGDGSGVDRATPGPVSNLTGVDAIAAGDSFSLARKRDGTLWAWGHNLTGYLGDGTFVDHSTPVQVPMSGVDLISAGQGMESHALVRKSDGSLWTWGSNGNGQLGDGAILERSTPTRLPGLTGITAIAAGDYHTLALAADGTVWAWGLNEAGQLGDNTSFGRSTPAPVPDLSGVNAIAAGGGHNLARLGDGTLVSWGDNCCGQLGRGNDSDTRFAVLTGVLGFSAGNTHSIAVRNDGTVWAWGSNGSGELGDGTQTGRFQPSQVPGLANVKAVSAGGSYTPYTLALKSDGTVWAWGDNSSGQLGDGTTTRRLSPVPVSGLADVMEISAGGPYALALKKDGSVWAWGANESGELGDGTTDNRLTPVRVSAISSATAIGASRAPYFSHSAAAMSDGTLWTWGSYHSGQMGDGALAQRVLPVVVVSEGGAGSIAGNDWFLDLDPARTKQIPPDKIPALLVIATGNTGGAVSDVDASVKFRQQDIGNPIYVFGYVPAALVRGALRGKDGGDCVLAQLSASGLAQQASASSLQAYVSNVISTQAQAIAVLNSVGSASVAGSTFCVGTATTSSAAVSANNSSCVATVPPAADGQTCLALGASTTSTGGGPSTKTLGSRATVSPTVTLYGGFELTNSATVYVLVRGNSLGSLGVTQTYLDAPRVRLYNNQGQDLLFDTNGPGFNGCASGAISQGAVVSYYTSVRGQPPDARDACIAQNLAAGAYTFSVTPSSTGVTSQPNAGEILFEVTLGAGSGSIAKTLGSRATVSQAATLYGGFEIAGSSNVYILVRGNSLSTLGVTQNYLDAPRVRIYDSQGRDLISDGVGTGFNGCLAGANSATAVVDYYTSVRHQAPHQRDACTARTFAAGAYTFSVSPSSIATISSPGSGEVLFEVTLQ